MPLAANTMKNAGRRSWRGYRPASCIWNVSFPTWRVAKHGCCFLELRYGELLRIPLPRTSVNKGKKKDRSVEAPVLLPPPARCAPFLELPSFRSRRTLQGGLSQRVHLSLRGLPADR